MYSLQDVYKKYRLYINISHLVVFLYACFSICLFFYMLVFLYACFFMFVSICFVHYILAFTFTLDYLIDFCFI